MLFNIVKRLFSMAKLPPNGSRRAVAEYVEKRVQNKKIQLKAIQPMILSEVDGTFFWAVKVIEIHPARDNIGIARKYESGFMIVKHEDNIKKIKEVFSALRHEKKKSRIPLIH